MMESNVENKLNKTQIVMNMLFSIVAFVLNLGISFFITPYITEQFGVDAYGFVKLANDFANYASVLSIALNSMASRFIMIEFAKGNTAQAKRYYSSITLANIILTAILMLPALICVVYVDKLLEVPAVLLFEVKLTFAITFATFLLNLCMTTFSNCFYLTNRLDKSAVRDALSNIIRVIATIFLLVVIKPRISYVALGTFISTIFVSVYNIYYTRKLTPELRFSLKDFDLKKLIQVLSSGIWNSITRMSQIFSSGLDLLMTNLLVGATEMGYLSVAKTVPNVLVSFNATIANVFSPNLMILYANGEKEQLKKMAKMSMKFMCLFVSIPNAILISMGKEFFTLWVPGQPADLINILSILTIINSCITGPLQPLYQIFTITNKVKQSSIVMIIYGFVSVAVTYICLQVTDLGIYAVAGVSLIGSVIVALVYHLPFAAIYIGFSWYTFFPEVFKSIISLLVVTIIGVCINYIFALDTWGMWFVCAILTAIIGVFANYLLILSRTERAYLISIVKSKIKR